MIVWIIVLYWCISNPSTHCTSWPASQLSTEVTLHPLMKHTILCDSSVVYLGPARKWVRSSCQQLGWLRKQEANTIYILTLSASQQGHMHLIILLLSWTTYTRPPHLMHTCTIWLFTEGLQGISNGNTLYTLKSHQIKQIHYPIKLESSSQPSPNSPYFTNS